MPISPENRDRYPKDWPEISRRIRFERAMGRCECRGECGTDHAAELRQRTGHDWGDGPEWRRCGAYNHSPHPVTKSTVVLTVAHLDHTPENCEDENLVAMCQRCHNRYDAPSRAFRRRRCDRT